GRESSGSGNDLLRALIPAPVLPRAPVEGEIWRVTGTTASHSVFDQKQRRNIEAEHITVTWAAPMVPKGAAIQQWIAKNPEIKGVGSGYAARLWDAYGSGLYELLRQRDVAALAKVLDFSKAAAIVEA